VIIDERRGKRQDRAVDAQAIEPRNLTLEIKERVVEVEHPAADRDADRFVVLIVDRDGKFLALLDEAKKRVRHEMTMHVGDHSQSPR
jgi:hypothetical protein